MRGTYPANYPKGKLFERSCTCRSGKSQAIHGSSLLTGLDLATSSMVSWMLRYFERLCPNQEIWPLDWNLSFVLRCLTRPPLEPLKLASDNFWPRCPFYLLLHKPKVLVSYTVFPSLFVIRVVGSHSTFSFLPDFVAMTQNPSMPDSRFEIFSLPSLTNFVRDDRAELLMFPIHALRRYLSRNEQYRPGIEGLFINWMEEEEGLP